MVALFVSMNSAGKAVNNVISGAAGELGLAFKGRSFSQSIASGIIDGFKVTIRPYSDPQNRSGISDLIRIYINHSINTGGIFRMTLENNFSTGLSETRLTGEEILVGDAEFDARFLIKGSSPLHVSALMNEGTRKKILTIEGKSHFVVLTSTWFEVVLRYGGRKKEDVAAITREALEVSKDLSRNDDVRARLLDNIRADSVPGVRAACIRHLASHFPSDSEITDLLSVTLKDPDLLVRIEAARHLGFEGLEVLTKMLEEGQNISEDETLNIIRFLEEHRFAGSIPVLRKMFESGGSEAVLMEILKVFTAIGDTGLNGFLVKHLEHNTGDIRDGLISALSTCGTVDAVEPLLKLSKSSISPFLHSDIQRSIASIQSRLGGADAGWLSVTETGSAEGALSMGDGAGDGALSIEGHDHDSKKGNRGDR